VIDNVALVFNRTGSVTNSGPISGGGVVSNINAGAVLLTANNSYAGNTVIAAGSIRLGASEVIPNGAGHGDVQLDGGDSVAGTLDSGMASMKPSMDSRESPVTRSDSSPITQEPPRTH